MENSFLLLLESLMCLFAHNIFFCTSPKLKHIFGQSDNIMKNKQAFCSLLRVLDDLRMAFFPTDNTRDTLEMLFKKLSLPPPFAFKSQSKWIFFQLNWEFWNRNTLKVHVYVLNTNAWRIWIAYFLLLDQPFPSARMSHLEKSHCASRWQGPLMQASGVRFFQQRLTKMCEQHQ